MLVRNSFVSAVKPRIKQEDQLKLLQRKQSHPQKICLFQEVKSGNGAETDLLNSPNSLRNITLDFCTKRGKKPIRYFKNHIDVAMKYTAEVSRRPAKYCATFMNDGRCFSPVDSAVRLEYRGPQTSNLVYICVHLDTRSHPESLPGCRISPVVEVTSETKKGYFKLSIPHCLGELLKSENPSEMISVQRIAAEKLHSLPYKSLKADTPLQETDVSEPFYDADSSYIHIYTREFSRFVCTHCRKVCRDNPVLFLTGKLEQTDGNSASVDLKAFLCSPLYKILDYKELLAKQEKEFNRKVWEEKALATMPMIQEHELKNTDIKLWIGCETTWKIRRPRPRNQKYWKGRHGRDRLFCVGQKRPLLDAFPLDYCDLCSEVYPQEAMHVFLYRRQGSQHVTPRVTFEGVLNIDILIKRRLAATETIKWDCVQFKTRMDINRFQIQQAFEARGNFPQVNFIFTDIMYLELSQQAITDYIDFYHLGYKLGFKQYEMDTINTNNPRNIRLATGTLISTWRNRQVGSEKEKSISFCNALENIGKGAVVESFLSHHHRI